MDFIVGGQWAALIAQTTATKDMDSANERAAIESRVQNMLEVRKSPFFSVIALKSFRLPFLIRSDRYIFVPNEPCPFFQICEIMGTRALADAKSHFPIRLRQQFRPDRTSEFPSVKTEADFCPPAGAGAPADK